MLFSKNGNHKTKDIKSGSNFQQQHITPRTIKLKNNYLDSCFVIPQIFNVCKSIETDQSNPIPAVIANNIKPPKIDIIFWLAKSCLASFNHSFKSSSKLLCELSRIFVKSLAVLSSKPAALYSSYTFKVSICDILKPINLVKLQHVHTMTIHEQNTSCNSFEGVLLECH